MSVAAKKRFSGRVAKMSIFLSLPFCVSLVEQRKLVIQKDSLVPFRVWLLDGRLALENGIFR